MKKLLVFCIALLAFAASAANDMEVELISGFHATAHSPVATGTDAQAYAYGVRGGTLLQADGGARYRFSIDCTGLDRMVNGKTVGTGHCAWSDAGGDLLYVSLQTGPEGNRYKISGGTGVWADATGTIKTRFTYLPSPADNLYLGVEEGTGTLSRPKPGE